MLTTENHKRFKVDGIKISFEHVDSWAKTLLFKTQHLWNSTTELILVFIYKSIHFCCKDSPPSYRLMIIIAIKRYGRKYVIGCIKICRVAKGQIISKANCQAVNSSKKRTNEFVFITMRRVFVRFLEEIEDTKKTFRNYLTFSWYGDDLWYASVSLHTK